MDWDGWINEECEDETWKVYYTEREDISDLDSSLSEDDACTIYMRHLMEHRFRKYSIKAGFYSEVQRFEARQYNFTVINRKATKDGI